jgi:hypothetical protein
MTAPFSLHLAPFTALFAPCTLLSVPHAIREDWNDPIMKAEDYRVEHREISGVTVKAASYRIGENFYCHVENLDPGATIARAEAVTREEAIQIAIQKAAQRLSNAAASTR